MIEGEDDMAVIESLKPDATTGETVFRCGKLQRNVMPCDDAVLDAQLKNAQSYGKWLDAFVELAKKHTDVSFYGTMPKRTDTARFQLANFLADHPDTAYSRSQLDRIQRVLLGASGRIATDVIQAVNKSDQNGLARASFKWDGLVWYCLPFVEYDGNRIATRGKVSKADANQSGDATMRAYYQSLADGKFEQGHRDPRKPLTAENFVWQPHEINATYRDTRIFDGRGLPVVPTPAHMLDVLKKYYTREERLALARDILDDVLDVK